MPKGETFYCSLIHNNPYIMRKYFHYMEMWKLEDSVSSFFMLIGLIFILPVVFLIKTARFLRE